MAKKRYPVISILVAIVWAAFFYPPDRVPPKTQVAKPSTVKVAPTRTAQAPVAIPLNQHR